MKLNPKTEATLYTIGALCLIALFVAIVMFSPELIYVITLSAVAIASVRFIYEIALHYIESRNKIKKLDEELYEKLEKN